MGRAKGDKLIQNRILAGGFGGLFILTGIALLVVGSMLYLALYEQYKNEQYDSSLCYVQSTSIEEIEPKYTEYRLHFVLLVNVNFTSQDNKTNEGTIEYGYYSDVIPAENEVYRLQRNGTFDCYYSTKDYSPRLERPPLTQYLAKGIGIVAAGIVALLGGLALELYLVISITKQKITVSKIAKNTTTVTTPPAKSVLANSNH